jgi:hypothetical protein
MQIYSSIGKTPRRIQIISLLVRKAATTGILKEEPFGDGNSSTRRHELQNLARTVAIGT